MGHDVTQHRYGLASISCANHVNAYFAEVFLTLRGRRHDLWHAMVQEGNILDL